MRIFPLLVFSLMVMQACSQKQAIEKTPSREQNEGQSRSGQQGEQSNQGGKDSGGARGATQGGIRGGGRH